MTAFLSFLRDYEMVAYYLLGLAALWFLLRFALAQARLSKASFALEQELLQGQRAGAAGKFLLIVAAAAGIYLAVQYGLPEAQRADRLRLAEDARFLPTITPTPTPLELFGVDVSGCNNPKARLIAPRPGEAVQGKVTVRIVADIADFAYYTIEVGRPDEPDVWVPLFNNNETAPEKEPFDWVWDSAAVTPGVYHLRLTVFAADMTFPPACVVPIQVLAPPL
jgi:hypothetical protein